MWQEWLGLRTGWSSVELCHCCRSTNKAYLVVPSILHALPRRDLDEIKQHCLKPGLQSRLVACANRFVLAGVDLCNLLSSLKSGPLFDIANLCPHTLRWCSMHVLNLGVVLWSLGGLFKLLLHDFPGVFGAGSDADRLACAYNEFKTWCSKNAVPHLGANNARNWL